MNEQEIKKLVIEKSKELLKSDLTKKWLFCASLILFSGIVLHIVLSINLSNIYIDGDVSASVSGSVDTDTRINGEVDISGNISADVSSGEIFGFPVSIRT